ncbi:MAG: SUMF1/EgtB/PvdO family nonheme iron enzyme [Nitrospira sp. CR2.1]|nr:SUMF1/EgtB/PvdO family nonheme iron enzyme [Nitrospira sp. CR2.1]
MLETRFKVVFLFAVLFAASLPIIAILRGTISTPFESASTHSDAEVIDTGLDGAASEDPLPEELVVIPAGPFVLGTNRGGFDEQPERKIYLDEFRIDRYEVTNAQYAAFVKATGHRKSGPPSRYAKNTLRMRGVNQPAVYVSWEDAKAYCEWRGRRLPSEAEWEKAMRGPDGRLWPWGNVEVPNAANWARVDDGFEVAAPVGRVKSDASPYGVMDGAGNVMEWVNDWYLEGAYAAASERNPESPEYGTYKVLRGAAYTSSGSDLRITARSKMMQDFRDETIGFRCAQSSAENVRSSGGVGQEKIIENRSSRGSETRPK